MKFDDFDFFAHTVKQAEITHKQLSAGHFSGSLEQIVGKHMILSIHRMNQFILQQGTGLKGYLTFLIPGDKNVDFTWRCNQLNSGVVGVLHGGMEHHCITHPNFVGTPVSVEMGYLLNLAESNGYHDFFKRIRDREFFLIDPEETELMRSEIRRIFRTPSFLTVPWEEKMAIRLIRVICGRLTQEYRRKSINTGLARRRIYHKAVKFMYERVMDPISVIHVAEAVGVSERNLRYAFHEVAKMSPKMFFDRLRLNEVRKSLRSGNFQKVVDVSQSFGYWHSGKFASDYKSLFSEYPSESLKQNF